MPFKEKVCIARCNRNSAVRCTNDWRAIMVINCHKSGSWQAACQNCPGIIKRLVTRCEKNNCQLLIKDGMGQAEP